MTVRDMVCAAQVDVIVPCFNAEQTVAAALASVIGQPGVAEIVAVDDGSTDGTLAVLREYEPAIRVLTGPNAGVSAARNRGIAQSKAPWLLFLDADDLLVPGTVVRRLALIADSQRDVVLSQWREFLDADSAMPDDGVLCEVDWAMLARDAEIACATRVWATPAAILYPRALVERIGGFRTDLPVVEDARLLFDAAAHGAVFKRLDEVGALYRVRPGSLSRGDPVRFWLAALHNGKQIEAFWQQAGTLTPARRAALGEIFNGAANSLMRLGHPAAREARSARERYMPHEPWKLRLGMAAMTILGGASARALFATGGAINRLYRARGG